MAEGAGGIDLHSHSTALDGQYPPAAVASRAAAAGLRVWGLTDHDTVAGLEPARAEATRLGMRFVPGIELSCFLDRREVHLLGHFIDPAHRTLRDFEDLLAEKRRIRIGEMVTKLAALGLHVSEEAVRSFSGGKTFGRPHVARALVQAGAVATRGLADADGVRDAAARDGQDARCRHVAGRSRGARGRVVRREAVARRKPHRGPDLPVDQRQLAQPGRRRHRAQDAASSREDRDSQEHAAAEPRGTNVRDGTR